VQRHVLDARPGLLRILLQLQLVATDNNSNNFMNEIFPSPPSDLIQLAVEVSPIATEVLVYWASVGVGIYGVIHHWLSKQCCRSSEQGFFPLPCTTLSRFTI
jgi:hypothetical protein